MKPRYAFSFDYYLVAADKEEVTETVTDEETGEETEQTSEKVTDATMAAAKENADKLLTAAQSGADETALSFSEAVTEVFGADASATEYTNTLGVTLPGVGKAVFSGPDGGPAGNAGDGLKQVLASGVPP